MLLGVWLVSAVLVILTKVASIVVEIEVATLTNDEVDTDDEEI